MIRPLVIAVSLIGCASGRTAPEPPPLPDTFIQEVSFRDECPACREEKHAHVEVRRERGLHLHNVHAPTDPDAPEQNTTGRVTLYRCDRGHRFGVIS